MQSRGRLIENVERFDALFWDMNEASLIRCASRLRGKWRTVPGAGSRVLYPPISGVSGSGQGDPQKVDRFTNGKVEDLGDVFPLIADLQDRPL